ncbi:MAG: type I methionyl aminopeptidase [Brevinematales bacterium]|nr:type I methionyl aminopeptidase [Brevinematales bacterium]
MSGDIIIKTSDEIRRIREASRIVAKTLSYLEKYIKPGISTLELDSIAEDFILSLGGKPAFKGYTVTNGKNVIRYNHSICASVNEVVIHGVPSKDVVLRDGDIISIDVGVVFDDYYGDGARTYFVGDVSIIKRKLSEVTKQALMLAIEISRPGVRVGEISRVIYEYVRKNGFDVIRGYTVHGVGKYLHESPPIPNYPTGLGPKLRQGMTIAIEPMVVSGVYKIRILDDGWSVCTLDGKPSAHWEHTVLITDSIPEILTMD